MANAARTTTTSGASSLAGFAPIAHAIFRIGTGLLFMQHGAQKLFGWFGGNTVELVSLMGLAGVLEFFGGLLIVLGLFTVPVAAILVLEMIVAYFRAHAPQGVFPIEGGGGELALLYMVAFLMLAAYGAGPASLDRMMSGRTTTDTTTTETTTTDTTTTREPASTAGSAGTT